MWKSLTKELHHELKQAHKKVTASRQVLNFEKQKARLTYEKFRLITERKPFDDIDRQLATLTEGKASPQPLDTSKIKTLLKSSNDINNLKNVVQYLKNQRKYDELLVRYNPGLSGSQEENVRKSANRVGLQAPE